MRRRPAAPQQPQQPAPALTWHTAEAIDRNANTDGARADWVLDRVEQAREGRRPVLLYVGTNSDDRRFERARAACLEMEETLWKDFDVATLTLRFELVYVDVTNLNRDVMRKYGITANAAPQVIIYDFQLRSLWRSSGAPSADQLKAQLERALAHCEALAARVDRTTSR